MRIHAALLVIAVASVVVPSSVVRADDYEIIGSSITVKNPGTPDKRSVIVKGKETGSSDIVDGDPTVSGATLTVGISGANANSQIFSLPQGTNAAGKPFWSGDATKGYKYKDAKGEQGPVTGLSIKKTASGTFSIAAKMSGKFAPLSIVPANPTGGSCTWLQLTGGGSYSVGFDGGIIVDKGELGYSQKKESGSRSCVPTCSDGLQNGGESDADCGGGVCPTCGNNSSCNVNSDCVGGLCDDNICGEIVAVCGNGTLEAPEFCDDGNLTPCDGCSPGCMPESGLTFTNGPDIETGIPDDGYDGTVGTMGCAEIPVAATGDSLVDYVCPTAALGHSWLGDLVIKLIAPDGTTVTLMSQAGFGETVDDGTQDGGDSSNLTGGSPITWKDSGPKSAENMGDTIGDDENACLDDGQCVYAPSAGAAMPAGNLSTFIGKSAPGIWQFCAGDTHALDIGSIGQVNLVIGQ